MSSAYLRLLRLRDFGGVGSRGVCCRRDERFRDLNRVGVEVGLSRKSKLGMIGLKGSARLASVLFLSVGSRLTFIFP
jgi:hypothetical protein